MGEKQILYQTDSSLVSLEKVKILTPENYPEYKKAWDAIKDLEQ